MTFGYQDLAIREPHYEGPSVRFEERAPRRRSRRDSAKDDRSQRSSDRKSSSGEEAIFKRRNRGASSPKPRRRRESDRSKSRTRSDASASPKAQEGFFSSLLGRAGTQREIEKDSPSTRRQLDISRTPSDFGYSDSKRRVTIVEKPLAVSLEDLYFGATKRLKINRRIWDSRWSRYDLETQMLDVTIGKGWQTGTRVKYSNIGDQTKRNVQDIHFIIEEVSNNCSTVLHEEQSANNQQKPHDTFRREGIDLLVVVYIDLVESLCGWEREIPTIDGKLVRIAKDTPTRHGWKDHFGGLGMPDSKDDSRRGDLIITVDVQYPSAISPEQKTALKRLLSAN